MAVHSISDWRSVSPKNFMTIEEGLKPYGVIMDSIAIENKSCSNELIEQWYRRYHNTRCENSEKSAPRDCVHVFITCEISKLAGCNRPSEFIMPLPPYRTVS